MKKYFDDGLLAEEKLKSYEISSELGRDREMTDMEFYDYVYEEWTKLSSHRREQIRILVADEPWKTPYNDAKAQYVRFASEIEVT